MMTNRRVSDRIAKRTRKPQKVSQTRMKGAIDVAFRRLGLKPKTIAFKRIDVEKT
jgi:hypothetical protein